MTAHLLRRAAQTIEAIHFTDVFPKPFEGFRSKYAKRLKDPGHQYLYVQFTNFADNTMDRNPHPNPDHSDPVGVYGYPLEYVIKHPADIKYGKSAKFLRVLRQVSKKSLNVTYMSESDAERVLRKMGLNDPRWLLQRARKLYKDRVGTGVTQWGKAFLTAVQMDLETITDDQFGEERGAPLRTGAEQTRLFLKAGYDCIEDTAATRSQAVINGDEPQQIIFLTRAAFRIDEVILLKPQGEPDLLTRMDEKVFSRKVAAICAETIGDKLKDADNPSLLKTTYWTRGGRTIIVAMQSNKPSGEVMNKKHKGRTIWTWDDVQVTIKTEFGDIFGRASDDEKMKDMYSHILRQWLTIKVKERLSDWQPDSKGQNELRVQQQREKSSEKIRMEMKQNLIRNTDEWVDYLDKLAEIVEMPPLKRKKDLPEYEDFSTYAHVFGGLLYKEVNGAEGGLWGVPLPLDPSVVRAASNEAWKQTQVLADSEDLSVIVQLRELLNVVYSRTTNRDSIANLGMRLRSSLYYMAKDPKGLVS